MDRLGHGRRGRRPDTGVRIIEHPAQPFEPARVLHPPQCPYSHCADSGILAPEVRTHPVQPDLAPRVLLGHDLGVRGVLLRGPGLAATTREHDGEGRDQTSRKDVPNPTCERPPACAGCERLPR